MREIPIWWPIRTATLCFLAGGMGAAFGGQWRIALASLMWLVIVLFLCFTRATEE